MAINKITPSGISYSVSGRGPVLILVNGLSRSSHHWVGFENILSDRFTIISFDPRGLGESKVELGWNLTVESMARDVKEIIATEKLDSAFIYGFSLGGMVAMTLALHHPNVIKKIVCVNSSVGGGAIFRINPRALITMAKGGLGRDDLHMEMSKFLLGSEMGQYVRKRAIDRWNSIERRHGRPVLQTIKQLGAAIRFTGPRKLRNISIPTLIICGKKDRFVPIANSQSIARLIPQSILKCVPGGGHELHVDKPLLMKNLLTEFLL